jgi:hypothetical protein
MTRRCASVGMLLLATIGANADPLDDLLAKGNGAACFERVYDDAHLAKNPRQKTRSVLLSLQRPTGTTETVLRLRFERTDGRRFVVGSCSWQREANLDVQGEKMIPAFKGPSGLDCHAMTSADGMSAEEGGDFPIDLRDGTHAVVHTSDSLAVWTSEDRSRPAKFADFGREDDTFRVDRTGTGRCAALVRDFAWLD